MKKRLISLILILLTVFSVCLTACEDTHQPTTPPDSSVNNTDNNSDNNTDNENPSNPQNPDNPSNPSNEPQGEKELEIINDGIAMPESFKVLTVGDESTLDSVTYLADIAKQLGSKETVIANTLYFNAGIADHAANIGNLSAAKYIYRKLDTKSENHGFVYESYEKTLYAALTDEDWDAVIINGAAYDAIIEEDRSLQLDTLVKSIKKSLPDTKIYYYMNTAPIHSDINVFYPYLNAQAQRDTANVGNITVIPAGTALQNTYLGFYYISHMNSDVANYISSLTILSALTNKAPGSVARPTDTVTTVADWQAVLDGISNALESPNTVKKAVGNYKPYEHIDDSEYLVKGKVYSAAITPYYNDRAGAVTLTFDDGCIASAEETAKVLAENQMGGTFLVTNDKYILTNEYSIRWYELLNGEYSQYADIGSHAYTGLQKSGLSEADADAAIKEATIKSKMLNVLKSYTMFSRIQKNSAVLGYATPGAGYDYANMHIQLKFPIFAADRLGSNPYKTLTNEVYSADFDDKNMYHLGSCNMVNNGNIVNLDSRLREAEEKNGWLIPLQHGLIPKADTNHKAHTVKLDDEGNIEQYQGWCDLTLEQLENCCKSYSGDIWFATYNDVLKYVKERKSATVMITELQENSMQLELTDELDNYTYNHELTVKVTFSNKWVSSGDKLTVRQGDNVKTYTVRSKNGLYINLNATPDAGTIYIIKEK